jgi:hypothetical protein
MYWFRFCAVCTSRKRATAYSATQVGVIRDEPKLDRWVHVAARCRQILYAPRRIPFDDQDTAPDQCIIRQQDLGMQGVVHDLLQRGATRDGWIAYPCRNIAVIRRCLATRQRD